MQSQILLPAHPAGGYEQPGKSGKPPTLIERLATQVFCKKFAQSVILTKEYCVNG